MVLLGTYVENLRWLSTTIMDTVELIQNVHVHDTNNTYVLSLLKYLGSFVKTHVQVSLRW